MLTLTVNVGQAVQIGEHGVVKVEDKTGRRVRLVFAGDFRPITLIADGIIPARFTLGITGVARRIHDHQESPVQQVA
ncbi:hypothetical protein [Mesorhizobium huakuii]|uniref:Uncharacterized protein n=1 Tax=Mesorhizobium huakuii TaxID=28104 RepID=A0A7G6T0U3_9HYPH|nr:hypothetical protein [Mesorhizobium huakuii]QND60375.1 hypothetical protein HB778_30385 [Mesorhizobium huakuii]